MKTFRTLEQDLISSPMACYKSFKLSKEDKIFSMGGCFSFDIYMYLKERGFNVLNREIGGEPKFMWYNTYTILYEFQRLIGEFVQDQDDIWKTPNGWQDPYRRLVFEPTKELPYTRIKEIDARMKEYILTANCIIMTLLLIEVFFINGRAICAIPGYGDGGGHGAQFRLISYEENLCNINQAMDILSKVNPSCNVIFNVSIVPIAKTFTEEDHMVASTEGLCVLRSVVGKICRSYKNAYYFPAYEHSLNCDKKAIYIDDARHVKKDFVSLVMGDFERIFT